AQVQACFELDVKAMVLFWDVNTGLVERLKARGITVIHQVGTVEQAQLAISAGADVIIAQGVEAGGHVHAQTALFALIPAIVAISPVPVVASGGIASGQALAAAL